MKATTATRGPSAGLPDAPRRQRMPEQMPLRVRYLFQISSQSSQLLGRYAIAGVAAAMPNCLSQRCLQLGLLLW